MSSRSPWRTDADWTARLERDRKRARAAIPAELMDTHRRVTQRARSSARALLLTGSTARRKRTSISDLDYHLIGKPIETGDLPEEVDLHVVSPRDVVKRLLAGDDFTQWSMRFGLVVFDDGIIRDCVRRIAEERLWPDVDRKQSQARSSLTTAAAMVESRDPDAALDQVRTALTLTARWRLLVAGRFPLSRSELPSQLKAIGETRLANNLAATIHEAPSLTKLDRFVASGRTVLEAAETASSAHARAA